MHHNFNDVNQLEGGIINYAHQIKTQNIKSKFIGKNFVFDKRMGERITEDVISKCHQCNQPADTHTNCKNQACHILFIQCNKCNFTYNGCCSTKCLNISKLPIDDQRKLRKKPNKNNISFKDRLRPKLKSSFDKKAN